MIQKDVQGAGEKRMGLRHDNKGKSRTQWGHRDPLVPRPRGSMEAELGLRYILHLREGLWSSPLLSPDAGVNHHGSWSHTECLAHVRTWLSPV
jgi:hypothetical protein